MLKSQIATGVKESTPLVQKTKSASYTTTTTPDSRRKDTIIGPKSKLRMQTKQNRTRKALSTFLRKKKESLEKDYSTWEGRIGVHIQVDEIDLDVLTEHIFKNDFLNNSPSSSGGGSNGGAALCEGSELEIKKEWEVDDRYYDVVRLWQKPFVVVPSFGDGEATEIINDKKVVPNDSPSGVLSYTKIDNEKNKISNSKSNSSAFEVLEEELKSEIIVMENNDGQQKDESNYHAATKATGDERTLSSALVNAGSSEIFIFKFGAVVFWNFPDEESERSWIANKLLVMNKDSSGEGNSFFGDLHDEEFVKCAMDSLSFEYYQPRSITSSDDTKESTKNTMTFRIKRDHATLNTREVGEKLALSFGFAKSSLLSIYEMMLEKTIERNAHIPEDMARSGTINMGGVAIRKEIGRIFLVKHLINLDSDLQDTPDEFWEDDRFEYVYEKCLAYFEIQKRLGLVNNRLEIIQDMHQVLIEAAEIRHSTNLEWIVILLIVIEILFEVLDYITTGTFTVGL